RLGGVEYVGRGHGSGHGGLLEAFVDRLCQSGANARRPRPATAMAGAWAHGQALAGIPRFRREEWGRLTFAEEWTCWKQQRAVWPWHGLPSAASPRTGSRLERRTAAE